MKEPSMEELKSRVTRMELQHVEIMRSVEQLSIMMRALASTVSSADELRLGGRQKEVQFDKYGNPFEIEPLDSSTSAAKEVGDLVANLSLSDDESGDEDSIGNSNAAHMEELDEQVETVANLLSISRARAEASTSSKADAACSSSSSSSTSSMSTEVRQLTDIEVLLSSLMWAYPELARSRNLIEELQLDHLTQTFEENETVDPFEESLGNTEDLVSTAFDDFLSEDECDEEKT